MKKTSRRPDAPATPLNALPAPRTREQLRRLLAEHLDLRFPLHALHPRHASPLDYLWHAFDENAPAPRDCVVWANRGGGKTFLGALATALDLAFKPGVEIRILAGSFDQARRMHTHLRRLFNRPALLPLIQGRMTDDTIHLTNGSQAELLAQSHVSVRGTRVQILRCDEVELFKLDVWEAAQLVTATKHCGEVQVRGRVECFSTMHLPYGLMSRLVRECKDGNRRLFRWGALDVLEACPPSRCCGDGRHGTPEGPLCPLLPECDGEAKKRAEGGHLLIDDAIVMKSRVSLRTWNSEMLSLHPVRTDAVYPDFDPARHVVEHVPLPVNPAPFDPLAPRRIPSSLASRSIDSAPPRPLNSFLAGIDFGSRSNAFILWAWLDNNDTLWIIDERCTDRPAAVADHAEALARGWGDGRLAELGLQPGPPFPSGHGWPRPLWVGADPAGNQQNQQTLESSIEVLRDAGLTVRARQSKILEGIVLVSGRIAPAIPSSRGRPSRPRLFVHKRCEKLIRALAEYHYPYDKPNSFVPVKDGPDHACDALRYLILNLDHPTRTTHNDHLAASF